MLAVLPFENLTGDSAQEYFSDGLTEEMIAQLGRVAPQQFGVIARTSVMHYKHTQEQLGQIGRELGVQYILEGSVRRDPDKVRISAQLIQVKDQTNLWARQYDRELRSLLTLQGEIAQEIADEIEITLGAISQSLPSGSLFYLPRPLKLTISISRDNISGTRGPSRDFDRPSSIFSRPPPRTPNRPALTLGWPIATRCWAVTAWCRKPSLC